MAEFSKQFCDNLDMDIEPDFDFEDMFDDLKSKFKPLVSNTFTTRDLKCDGFGIVAIAIANGNKRKVGFHRTSFGKQIIFWKDYDEVLQMTKPI